MEGFDVSALMGGKDMQVWVDFNDQVKVQIKHVARERFAELISQATTASWDRKHQKTETLDNLKFGELLGVDAIGDWSGLVIGGEPFLCTPENIKVLMRKWLDFAKFIGEICTDLERLVEAEKEAVRKN